MLTVIISPERTLITDSVSPLSVCLNCRTSERVHSEAASITGLPSEIQTYKDEEMNETDNSYLEPLIHTCNKSL